MPCTTLYWPTATQLPGAVHEMALKPLELAPAGATGVSRLQDAPFHSCARGAEDTPPTAMQSLAAGHATPLSAEENFRPAGTGSIRQVLPFHASLSSPPLFNDPTATQLLAAAWPGGLLKAQETPSRLASVAGGAGTEVVCQALPFQSWLNVASNCPVACSP